MDAPDIPIAALTWRCRRGMRELDQLLLGFLRQHYAGLEARQQHAFVDLLEMQDPDIFGFLVRGEIPTDAHVANIVRQILSDTDTAQIQS